MSKPAAVLGQNIRLIRTRLGESQEEFAARLGVGKGAVSKYEAGLSSPDLSGLMALEALSGFPFAVLVSEVVGGPADPPAVREPPPERYVALPLADVLAALDALRAELAEVRKRQELMDRKIELMDSEILKQAGRKR